MLTNVIDATQSFLQPIYAFFVSIPNAMKVVWFHMVVVVWWCEELLQSLGEWGRRRLCAVEERRPLCAMAFSSHYENCLSAWLCRGCCWVPRRKAFFIGRACWILRQPYGLLPQLRGPRQRRRRRFESSCSGYYYCILQYCTVQYTRQLKFSRKRVSVCYHSSQPF